MSKDMLPISLLVNTNGACFCKEVETMVQDKEIGYMQAVLDLCEKHNLEPASAAKLLSKPIIEKIQVEGQKIHLLPRSGVLPI
jgi:hypothetical protein